MDYIFISGTSAVGKTTLAKKLYTHYQGVYVEQHMVPEFSIPKDCADEGVFEEQVCWDNMLLQCKWFYEKGFRNIVALDFDDRRMCEIPLIFKGYRWIALKLVSSDPAQIRSQMIHRHENEGGLYCPDKIEDSNNKIMGRALLPNEIMIDISGKTKEQVSEEAIRLIDSYEPSVDYHYEPDDESHYLSWVKSRNL